MNADPLSVIMLAEDYLPNIGGIAVHVHNLATSLAKKGCRVTIISTRKKLPKRNFFHWQIKRHSDNGIEVIQVPIMYSPRNLLFNFQVKYRFARLVNDEVKKRKTDIFHWHNIHFDPDVVAHVKKGRMKMIFTNHSSQFLKDLDNEQNRSVNSRNLNYADEVIAPSRELVDATIQCRVDPRQVHYIPNGVNTSVFAPDENKKKQARINLNIGQGEIAIICPRRIVPKCGIVYLAKALSHLKTKRSIAVYFTGLAGGSMTWRDISYENEVRSELASCGKNVRTVALRHLTNDEIHFYLTAMDIAVLPSLIEATSIACLEAMSMQLAVITTNVGGLPELIDHEKTGLLVEPADHFQLAQAIDVLSENSDLRKELADNARKKVLQHFDWKVISEQTLAVYHNKMPVQC